MIAGLTVLYEPEEDSQWLPYKETYTFVDPKGREMFALERHTDRWVLEHTWSQRYIKTLLRRVFPDLKWTLNYRGYVESVELTTLHLAMLRLVRQNRYSDT